MKSIAGNFSPVRAVNNIYSQYFISACRADGCYSGEHAILCLRVVTEVYSKLLWLKVTLYYAVSLPVNYRGL